MESTQARKGVKAFLFYPVFHISLSRIFARAIVHNNFIPAVRHINEKESSMPIVFWILYAVFLMTQGFILYRYISTGNKMYVKSVLTTNILFALYVAADEIFGIGVPYLIRCMVIVALFIHTFFGYFKDLYTRSQTFDRYIHTYGSFAYALFFYILLSRLVGASVSPKCFAAVMVAFTGIAAGGVFEIIEYFVDKKMPVKTQRGLKDTDVDLICDVIGSVLAGVAAYLFWL